MTTTAGPRHMARVVRTCASARLPSSGHGHFLPDDTLTSFEGRPLPQRPACIRVIKRKSAIITHMKSPRERTVLLTGKGA